MVFLFFNLKLKEIEINIIFVNFKELYDLENLVNIELEMSFDLGLLNFFGLKSIIKIYNWKLDSNKNNIKLKINIKVYVLGICIK